MRGEHKYCNRIPQESLHLFGATGIGGREGLGAIHEAHILPGLIAQLEATSQEQGCLS